MACFNPECIGNSSFERIAFYARRRFIDGIDTITLMTEAPTERDKRDVALAALLDLDDASLRRMNLFHCPQQDCKAHDYRRRLKQLLAADPAPAVGF